MPRADSTAAKRAHDTKAGGLPAASRYNLRSHPDDRTKAMSMKFAERVSVEQVEEGDELAPKFDERGLIPAVTTDYETGELLMHGYMNAEALRRTIETREAHYFSRSRQALWHKGATSGLVQRVRELLIDDDQDCVWLRVDVAGGASCHVGYRSCFYRRIPLGHEVEASRLVFTETEKVFDPVEVYGDAPNPTKL
jgi:phosphoribosyl-AMP cyclohydrolase